MLYHIHNRAQSFTLKLVNQSINLHFWYLGLVRESTEHKWENSVKAKFEICKSFNAVLKKTEKAKFERYKSFNAVLKETHLGPKRSKFVSQKPVSVMSVTNPSM